MVNMNTRFSPQSCPSWHPRVALLSEERSLYVVSYTLSLYRLVVFYCSQQLDTLTSLTMAAPSTAPFNPGLFERKRHELNSATVGGHFPHLPTPSLKAHGNGLWFARIIGPPYRVYLLSNLRTSPPLKRRQQPQIGIHRC
ncbi:hypothetical protein AVEN_90601-1 [Araneus ventricosus]|uniref:Uncharacterized protein n=1 Tax=Araneus ventricosus TaxID=182803 RepID=A0A4Y2K1N1_ARAVE|nr:hypothetical protein AVEN_90601-1 [Araneus ventricosus]